MLAEWSSVAAWIKLGQQSARDSTAQAGTEVSWWRCSSPKILVNLDDFLELFPLDDAVPCGGALVVAELSSFCG